MDTLEEFARLLAERNFVDAKIAHLINRPAEKGHIAEYLAARIFATELHASAAHIGSDGYFTAGPLMGHSVNVKYEAKHDGLLDINPESGPDNYLVIVGPKTPPISSMGTMLPFVIASVFLFEGERLLADLHSRGINVEVATSVKAAWWSAAEIYPIQRNPMLPLSEEQRR